MTVRRILLVNGGIGGLTGTEAHVRDHALAFLRRGHEVVLFGGTPSGEAGRVLAEGATICSDLSRLSAAPDIILGNQHLPLMLALLRFREVPAAFHCHDASHENGRSPIFPRVVRHLAVDWNCRERVARETGRPEAEIEVVPNTVDTARFAPRERLPDRPRRAAVFANRVRPGSITVSSIAAACRRRGISLDVIGAGMGTAIGTPEAVLGRYDIIFAKARCALEALAVGCHVILCDPPGLGPAVVPENFDELRRWNFGRRLLVEEATPAALRSRIESYNPAASLGIRDRVRSECGVEHSAGRLLAVCEEVIEAWRGCPRPDPAAEYAALARYIEAHDTALRALNADASRRSSAPPPGALVRFVRSRPALRRFLRRLRGGRSG